MVRDLFRGVPRGAASNTGGVPGRLWDTDIFAWSGADPTP
jgi:hypothetical protein